MRMRDKGVINLLENGLPNSETLPMTPRDVIEGHTLRFALKKGQNIIKAYACLVAKCTCVLVHVVGTKIEALKSRISNLRTSMQDYGIQSVKEGEQDRALMPEPSYAYFEEDIVGREVSIEKLVRALKDEKQHRVVSICGMGGLGLKDIRAAFPVKNTRSKLLITTRNRQVAEAIDPHGFIHELPLLSNEESRKLLMKMVFPKTERVGQAIVVDQAVEGIARRSETEGRRQEKLPEHRNLPQQLRKLVLFGSRLEEDPMPILERLQHLVVLILGPCAFMGKEMVCSAGGFPQLKHLVLGGLPNLEEWRVAEGAMPHLSRLGINGCPKLKAAVPEGVHVYDGHEALHREWRKFFYYPS
ncbi:hypothetical protein NL676_009972 [Syzygium grande]|nr:hypothetical protein NL676_009972 [Syzygium grande]